MGTTLTWSTLLSTGSSLESRVLSICANPWAPAGPSRSSPVRSASKEWSGLRLIWRTPSSRLKQLCCSPERPQCIPAIQHHFIPMHVMVMERFMVPTDICNNQFAACNPDRTTHPHPTEGPHPTHPHPTHPRM